MRSLDRSGHQTRIVLDPLSPPDTRELVRRLMPEGPTGSLVARLHDATGGNPLFMLETLRAIHERQVMESLKPPTGVPALDVKDLPVSGTVFEMISSRLDALPGEPRQVAGALAANGSGMDIDALAEVCGLPRPQALDAVDYLIRAGMISTATGHYSLTHEHLGQVAYESMPADDRPDLHRRLAWRLEGDRSFDPASLGHHFRLGAVPSEAARYLELAGEEARAVSAFATARDRYTEALLEADKAPWQEADQARLRLALEQILEVLADRDGQARLLDELEETARNDPPLAAEVTLRRAWLLAATARFEEAGQLAADALELHTRLDDTAGRARALQALGTIALWGSHYVESAEWLEKALELAPTDSILDANIRQALCDSLHQLYRFAEAQEHVSTALATFEHHQDLRGLAGALGSQGALYGQQGEYALVEQVLLRATDLCETIGYRYGAGINALNLGHLFTIAGQAARALSPAQQSRTIFLAMNNRRGVALASANLGSLHHDLGNDARAEQLVKEALAIFESLDQHAGAALCHGTLADVARRRGDPAQAWESISRGMAIVTGYGNRNGRLQLHRTEAHLLLDAGELRTGLRVADEALAECAAAGADWLLPDLTVPLARALVLTGQAARAVEITTNLDSSSHEAALLYWRTRAFELLGDHGAAQTALEAAHQALLRKLEGLSPKDSTASLANVPLYRRIDAAWQASRPLTITVRLAAASAPTGRPVSESELIDVTWTIHDPVDDQFREGADLRRHQLQRLTAEAEQTGAAPTIADLAAAVDVSTATVRRDIDALRRSGKVVRTRGRRR